MIKKSKTFVAKPADVQRAWHVIDLSGKVLGRAVTTITNHLIGKTKPTYTPHVDAGDYVVAINAAKVAVTGRKLQDKLYQWHSGHPGGFKTRTFTELRTQDARRIIERAVSGMLPKNKHRQDRLTRLKIFAGNEHPFADKFKGVAQ